MSTPSIAPHDVLVIASRSDISAIHVVDGAVLWVHSVADAWPLVNIGIPFLSRPEEGVVLVCAGKRLAWIRLTDGHILGTDEVWFHIERVVHQGSTVVVQGASDRTGLACYRNNVRVWGIVGVPHDPRSFLSTQLDAWTADAHGQPVARAGEMQCQGSVALALGTSVTQIDRTT